MARINGISYPGITVEKDWRGNISDVKINLKRCSSEIKEMLKAAGIIKEETGYDPKFVKKIQRRRMEKSIPVNIDDL